MLDAPGAGLAAPQIGVGLRVFTYYVDDELGPPGQPGAGPVGRARQDGDEGCLSLPGPAFRLPRALRAWSPRASNMYGEPVTRRGHRPARPLRPARDRPPRRRPLRRPARPGAAQGRDEGDPRGRVVRRAGARRSRSPPHPMLRPKASECGSSSPARPRRRSRRCDALLESSATRSSRSSPGRDAPAGRGRRATPSPVARARRRGRHRGPHARQGRATRTSSTGCASSRPTAARSSRTARCCRARRWTSPRTAGSTCTSRCCPPGAAPRPCSAPILHGDDVTGATTFQIEAGLDTGPVYGVVTEPIRPDDTAGDLLGRLADAGAGLLVATMDGIEDGVARAAAAARRRRLARPEARPSRTPRSTGRSPAFARRPAVRACTPAPGAWTTFRGERVKLGPVRACAGAERWRPASCARPSARCWSAPAPHPVALGDVQPQGKQADAGRRLGARRARPADGTVRLMPTGRGPARAGSAPAAASRRPTRPRRAAFDVLRAVDDRDAYANLVLPALLRERGLQRPRRRVRHRAGLRHAARPRHLRRGARAVRATAAGRDRRRRCSTSCGSARTSCSAPASRAHAAVGDHRRPGPRGRPGPGGPSSPTRCCARSRRATSTPGWRSWRRRTRDRRPPRASRTATRAGSSSRLRDALGRRLGEIDGAARRRQRAPARHARRPARPVDRGRAVEPAASPAAYSPYAVRWPRATRARIAAVREGRAAVQDEGSQLVALALAAAPRRRAGRALARPVRRPRRQGGAAGGAGRASAARACSPPTVRRTAPASSRRAAATGAGSIAADGTRAGLAAGGVRPGARRRAVHRPGRAAAPPGGALAARPGASPHSAPLQRGLLASALDAVRPGGVVAYVTCSPAPGRDPGGGRRRPARPRRRRAP